MFSFCVSLKIINQRLKFSASVIRYNIAMKRLLRYLIVLTAAVILLAGSVLAFSGYRCYRAAVAERSIPEAVEAYADLPGSVTYDEIDTDFVHAVVAVEDKRYFTREGIDWIAMCRAIINNLLAGRPVEGGSTIPQQIAKNLYFIGQGKTRGLPEKTAEIYIMHDLEDLYSKEELLALYASMNYYGDGYWGLAEASMGYYGVPANDLTIAQAAMLAGITNAPSAYQLSTGYELAESRWRRVLRDMLENHYISQKEYDLAHLEDMHPVH